MSTGNSVSVAFVATCPPRQCGIATFTADLVRSIHAADPLVRITWAAIDEPGSAHEYDASVAFRIRQGDPASYVAAARRLNAAGVDVVSLQHEFGLYGVWGEPYEDHLAAFLEELRRPLVTTLHTVLPEPSPSVRAAVQAIGRHSEAVVVMAETAREILEATYQLDAARIRVIPHGVPPIVPRGRTLMKERLGLSGRTVLSTFGLVDPRKGLEYMVEAMTSVAARHPDVLYLIIGSTHPELLRRQGESYREELQALVRARGLEANVAFVDAYLSQQEIIDYLIASDVYVTPYLDPNQITSGTLSYALGAGKAIVSTPYLHAVESLAGGRGLLVGFRNAGALAEAALFLLENPEFARQLEINAYRFGREMAWPEIGGRVARFYREVARTARPRAALEATGGRWEGDGDGHYAGESLSPAVPEPLRPAPSWADDG